MLSVLSAFIGYVLPYGQMSYWGATVIISMVSALPVVGVDAVHLIWAGYEVDLATVSRFFAIHYLLPLLAVVVVVAHLACLHETGSSSVGSACSYIPFDPYFRSKDSVGVLTGLVMQIYTSLHAPNALGHPDNYINADGLVTPAHIVPEWYFLPFYAVLRSVPSKLLGVVLMLIALLVLALAPFNSGLGGLVAYRVLPRISVACLLVVFLVLGVLGGLPAESPFVQCGRVAVVVYFIY